MEQTLIFGHKNPDTDSICSSISYAYLKNTIGESAIAARLGDLSKETEFVLKYFGVKKPMFIDTVSPQLADLNHIEKGYINVNDSLKTALDTLTQENFSSLPIINNEMSLVGMLHVSDIANTYLQLDYKDLFSKYPSDYENLRAILNGNVISGEYPTGTIQGELKAASEFDTVKAGDIVVTTTNVDGIDKAIFAGAKLIIVCANKEDFISPRLSNQCAIMRVETNLFQTLKLITQSISVSAIMPKKQFYHFKEEDFLMEVKGLMKEADQSNFPVVGKNGKLYGTVRSKNLIDFNRKNVILMDHNEHHQSVNGIKDAKILEVVDHHKFGNFETNEPLVIRAETVGCCCTIVYKLFKEHDIVPPKEIAGLMASAILSDTLIFKSPTCTEQDIIAARELCEIAEVDPKKYGMEMLIAGTSLGNKSPMEILDMDNKTFNMADLDVSISQINAVDVSGILKKKGELEKVMNQKLLENGYDVFILVITDIINSGSQIIVLGDSTLVENAFGVKLENKSAWLEGVLSRKKQLVPSLLAASQAF